MVNKITTENVRHGIAEVKKRFLFFMKANLFQNSKNGNLFSIMRKMDFDIFLAGIFIFDIIILVWNFHILKININLLLNLTAIYAIVGAFLGSLFIFIMAEGLRDKEQLYKIKIFFKSSKLITIIILFLLFLAFLPFHENKFILNVSFIALFGFIGLSIYAISQIALVTLNDEILWKRHIDLFKNRIKQATKFSQIIRSNTKKFHHFIKEPKNKIKWTIPKIPNQVALKSLREGTITYINLRELKHIVGNIKKHEAKNTQSNQTNQGLESDKRTSLYIDIGQKVTKRSVLLSYNKNIHINNCKIQKQLNNALSIERTTIIDEVQMELENYKSMIKKYIEEENTFQFERYFELYFKLAEEFLNQLSKPYSYEDAKREMPYFNSSSPLLDWLIDHIMTFFDYAKKREKDNLLKTGELDKITRIRFFNYHLITLSINNKDHLFFKIGFSLWFRQLYYLSKGADPFYKRKSIIDHLDFFENHLMPTVFFGEQITKETEGYAIYLLEMLKNIFVWILRKDKSFEFLNDFEGKIIQVISNISANPFHVQENTIDMSRVFNELQSYDSKKLQFLFGLGAYLDKLTSDDLKISDKQKTESHNIQNTIKKFIMHFFKVHTTTFDLKNFLNMYHLMKKEEVDSFWTWGVLNMPLDKKQSQKENNIEIYFLKLMFDINKTEFDKLNIEQINSQTLAYLECLQSTIDQKLQILNTTEENKNKIRSLLKNISDFQQKKRTVYVSKGVMEQNKVIEFINKFEESFKKNSYMRTLFKNKKVIQKMKDDCIKSIDKIRDKSYFMSHQSKHNNINLSLSYPVDFSDEMPQSCSDDFSERENEFIQSEILKKCEKKEQKYNDFKNELFKRKWANDDIMLISTKEFSRTYNALQIKRNIPRNKKTFEYSFLIQHKDIPLKFVSFPQDQNVSALIFDKSKLPILEMFDPIDQEKELLQFRYLEKIGISIGIDAFSHNKKLMEFMINKPPNWLAEKGDEKIQREYLNQMVNIKILQGLYLNWQGIEQIGESFVIKD